MEFIILGLIPILFLLAAASMIVVGQLAGFFQFVRFTERKRQSDRAISGFVVRLQELSGRLRLSNEELVRLNSLKSRFLSVAAHDMKTPVATIRGFGEVLAEREYVPPKDQEHARYIVQASDQIGRLLADLTDLAMIEAGKLAMEKAPFEFSEMARGVLPAISWQAQEKGVEFVLGGLPEKAVLVGDKLRLGQVLTNLLVNAVKFTPPGGRVEFRAETYGSLLNFHVKDTGPGIPPSEREKIFEKFYQGASHQRPGEPRQGWGLGLSIAQEIVRAHRGQIGVRSPGRGSTFWVRLPLAEGRAARLQIRTGALLALALLGIQKIAPVPIFAQPLPLEDKARYEKFLEEKAESALLRILGPNRAKVVVDAAVDFSRVEKFDVKAGALNPQEAAEKTSWLLWQSFGGGSASGPELLPGIPAPQIPPSASGKQSYERHLTFPASFLKRLSVTVILDRTVGRKEAAGIEAILFEILGIQPSRGDVLKILQAPFAPAWRTFWYSPDSVGQFMKYALLALMILVTLSVVAVCFLKLAGAMSSMAKTQVQQAAVEFALPRLGEPPGPAPGAEGTAQPPAALLESDGEGVEPPGPIVFRVKLDQAGTLAEILKNDNPDDIALVVAHLPPEVRNRFLDRLPGDLPAEVILRLSKVRFVDPDFLLTVKEEMERRLAGAVGGMGEVLRILQGLDDPKREAVLHQLDKKSPKLAGHLRRLLPAAAPTALPEPEG